MNKKPNIILLTVDSLRADCCGFINKEAEGVTPNIDALARDATVFERTFSTGPETPFSFPGILTSTYPLDFGKDPSHPDRKFHEMGPPRKLLSETLQENGYTTAGFLSNVVISDLYGYNRGWDYFECLSPPAQFLNPGFSSGAKVRLKDRVVPFLRSALLSARSALYSIYPNLFLFTKYLFYKRRGKFPEWLNDTLINDLGSEFVSAQDPGAAKPFFLWLHYMGLHTPYYSSEGKHPDDIMGFEEFLGRYAPDNFQNSTIAKPLVRRLAERYAEKTKGFYKERATATDRKVGDFIRFLKERGLYDDALIILTADHGDEFMEHGGLTHSAKLYNELLHVPLLIKLPRGKGARIAKKVSLVDLSTTVCDVVGVDRPKVYRGVNLFKDTREFVVHQVSSPDHGVQRVIRACQNADWKYILRTPSGKEELYNLKNDPGEKKNLAATERDVAKKMRGALEALK